MVSMTDLTKILLVVFGILFVESSGGLIAGSRHLVFADDFDGRKELGEGYKGGNDVWKIEKRPIQDQVFLFNMQQSCFGYFVECLLGR
jgi:hypothetical protein